MELIYLNLDEAFSPVCREIHTVIPAMILSEKPLFYASTIGSAVELMESDFLDRRPKYMLDMFRKLFTLHLGEEYVSNIVNTMAKAIQINNKKIRSKTDIVLQAKGKILMASVKKMVLSYMMNSVELNRLEKINSYWKKGDVKFCFASHSIHAKDSSNERLTEMMAAQLTDDVTYFVFTENMLGYCSVKELDDDPEKDFFEQGVFLTEIMPLPGCMMLKQNRLKLLKDDLQPQLEVFQKAMDKTYSEVKKMTFDATEFPELKEKINAMLLPAARALKIKGDENMYFQQLGFGEFGEMGGSFMLGITSRKNFIRLLFDTLQIKQETFDALEKLFSELGNLNSPYFFFLHDMPEYPPLLESIDPEQVSVIWKESFL